MPLIVPGLTNAGDQQQSWMAKLAGKTIGSDHSDQVQPRTCMLKGMENWLTTLQSFAQKDLPANHRIVKEDSMQTMDHDPNRMNVYVANDGTVRKVEFK
jgi:hypothetical protein